MSGLDPAPADAVEGAAPRARGRLALVALVLLLVASAVVGVVSGMRLRDDRRLEEARRDALTAARQQALNLTSVDMDGFDADVKRVLDAATGEFKADFAQRAANLRQVLQQNQVRQQGKVLEAGVVRADRLTASVLVVVDSTVRNRGLPRGRVNTYRMRLGLEREGGRWLVATLEFVV